jgi:3',5'-cyclic AMP phosphodiesterase CpdA
MLIAHISDTHIAGPGLKTNGLAPMAENLSRCVDAINALTVQPDLVLLSGDVANDATRDEALRAGEILAGLNSPLYLVPGNHDDRDVLWDVFGGGAVPSRTDGFINYVVNGPDLRIIALDTVAQGKSGGAFCNTRAAWLREMLAGGGDQPTIIFMHHPPLKCGVPETDQDGFDGAKELGAIIAAYPNIQRILCGHIHLLTTARWNGAVVTTAPSMGMQLTLDLTQKRPSRFYLTDPGYLLHHWTPDKVLITHAVTVRDMDGPYEFRQH